MRKVLYILLACFSTLTFAEIITYDTTFNGIKVGSSTIANVIEAHGPPTSKVLNSNNIKYEFKGFDVTIQDATGRVNTIIIYDSKYKDKNGISVGYSNMTVAAFLKVEAGKGVILDYKKGISYWFKNGKVEKIVFAHEIWKG